MAMIFCPECGKQISDTASACPNCGYQINGGHLVAVKKVRPGRGFGITSMIMGILGVIYGVASLNVANEIRQYDLESLYYYAEYDGYEAAFILTLIFGILAVSFGGVSRSRGFNGGQQKSGIIMGIISIAASLLAFMIAA